MVGALRKQTEVSTCNYLVKQARKLRQSKGILAEPKVNLGKQLVPEIKEKVLEFYESDENSRMCPGAKIYVSVRIGGIKQQKQTREGFLRKNIVAVSFFQNCAIHQYS